MSLYCCSSVRLGYPNANIFQFKLTIFDIAHQNDSNFLQRYLVYKYKRSQLYVFVVYSLLPLQICHPQGFSTSAFY